MVTVNYKFAGLANESSDCQRHLLNVATSRTGHRRVARIHFLKLPTSVFSFAGKYRKELAPRNIGDGFTEMAILHHPLDIQILYNNSIKASNQLGCFFVVKVLASARNFSVSQCDFLTGFDSVITAALLSAQSALKLGKCVTGFCKVAWILNTFAGAKRCKRLNANIYADLYAGFRQGFRLRNFTNQQSEPAIGSTGNSQLLNPSFNWTAQANAASPNAWNVQLIATQGTGTLLFNLLTERVVAVLSLEARKACIALEECLIALIQTVKHIGLNSPRYAGHFRELISGFCNLTRLLKLIQAFASLLVVADSLFKQTVVEKAARTEDVFTRVSAARYPIHQKERIQSRF